MKTRNRKNIQTRKEKIAKRLERTNTPAHEGPVLAGGTVQYEMSGRQEGVAWGGLAAIHEMARRMGLPEAINEALPLLKTHAPYYESDHVLNLAYNTCVGGTCLEDLERLRQDEAYLNMLGAARIPDPTTAGDFLRRFQENNIIALMEVINNKRPAVWRTQAAQDAHFFDEARLDVDATISETLGECKEGMDISYKGIWGYAPLLVTLAKTREVLYIANRPGNTRSCDGAAPWIDRAIALVAPHFKKVTVRGDSDYSMTEYLDGWDAQHVEFVFGYRRVEPVLELARSLPESAWNALERPPKYVAQGPERTRPENVKERIVEERGYKTLRLEREDVAEFSYRPTNCKQDYRMVAVRKTIHVEQGQQEMFPEIRYFFYITNNWTARAEEIVFSANQRCDQENIIAQMKSGGLNALHAPADNLLSNWAYMVIASLAWTFKAWYGLLMPDRKTGHKIVRMEYKAFLHNFIALPCQIAQTARRIVVRVLGYNRYLETFFDMFDAIRRLRFT